MTFRLFILFTLVFGLAFYAWKDWFLALLGLIVLSSLMNHPDMPRTWFGVTGANCWNFLFLAVLVPWYQQRGALTGGWDAPGWAKTLYVSYIGVVVIAVFRAIVDRYSFPGGADRFSYSIVGLVNDYILNATKYTAPGLLLFDGARTRRRVIWGLIAALTVPLIYSIIISRHIGAHALTLPYNYQLRIRRHIGKTIGFHANTCSQVLAGSVWGILALAVLRKRFIQVVPVFAHAGYVMWGLLLCLSRAGYIAFAGVGAVFALLIWRTMLILFPIGLALVWMFIPSVSRRLLAGFNVVDPEGNVTTDMGEVTAGRTTVVWPPVVEAIKESPLFGYGRMGIRRCSAEPKIRAAIGGAPDHPHCAYLEILLDTGIVGAIPVVCMYIMIIYISYSLARDRSNPVCRAVGCAAFGAVLSLLIMGVSGQSLFPKEASQVSWCLYGLAMRVYVERGRNAQRRQIALWARRRQAMAKAEAAAAAVR